MSIQDKVWETTFDEFSLMKKYDWLKPYTHGEHSVGVKIHPTDIYKFDAGDLKLEWSFCPECKTLRTKRVVGLGKDADGYDTAYIKDIVSKGEKV